ncbi:unnamed protein product, partial [Laminaria digitata]
ACGDSPSSRNRLMFALCQRACSSPLSSTTTTTPTTTPTTTTTSTTTTSGADLSLADGGNSGNSGSNSGDGSGGSSGSGDGFSPILLPPASFAALARLLRASLDRAASDREFLQARNCLVASGLFAAAKEGGGGGGGGGEGGGGGGRGGGGQGRHSFAAVLADVNLVSAAAAAENASAGFSGDVGGGGGGWGGGEAGGEKPATAAVSVGYLLQRELRRHPVWSTVELWEVSMSDSVVMAMEGGGARSERWLPAETMAALEERFGGDVSRRQLDMKLGQLAFFGHSMLGCGLSPSEVRSLLRKCSSLAMEIPPKDLEALMAVLASFANTPGTEREHPRTGSASSFSPGGETGAYTTT